MLEALHSLPRPCCAWAGNGFEVYKERLHSSGSFKESETLVCSSAAPHALALLRLAPVQWARGQALAPDLVQPLYIRDKVAQTTAEREAIKAAKMSA
jgi:tRNA threonylcarbamoyladenosine biosynthesis protein TsaB